MDKVIGVIVIVLGSIGFGVLFGILSALLQGWILSVLWGWFIVPVFHLPGLSIPFAIGIALVIGLLTSQRIPDQKDEEHKSVNIMVYSFIYPLIVLMIGYLVHLFV